MKPDWDKLIAAYKDSTSVLIADVDCTGAGQSKCEEVGVQGYPTIKYGDPDDLQDYEGGRSFDELKTFAAGLGPTCSPANLDLCDDDKKKLIEELQAMPTEELAAKIKEQEDIIEKTSKDFDEFVEGLQKQYEEKSAEKDKIIADIKSSGLGLLKAVHKMEAKTEL